MKTVKIKMADVFAKAAEKMDDNNLQGCCGVICDVVHLIPKTIIGIHKNKVYDQINDLFERLVKPTRSKSVYWWETPGVIHTTNQSERDVEIHKIQTARKLALLFAAEFAKDNDLIVTIKI